jgi:hypothetical protein
MTRTATAATTLFTIGARTGVSQVVIGGRLPAVSLPPLAVPALGVPALGVPALGVPALGAPALGAPALGAPALGVPARVAGGPAESLTGLDDRELLAIAGSMPPGSGYGGMARDLLVSRYGHLVRATVLAQPGAG